MVSYLALLLIPERAFPNETPFWQHRAYNRVPGGVKYESLLNVHRNDVIYIDVTACRPRHNLR